MSHRDTHHQMTTSHPKLWRAGGPATHGDIHTELTSFWGKITATIDWCERNYVFSSYIAEFWNTISNFAIIALAWYGLVQARKYRLETRFVMCYLSLMIVGIGSTIFHCTLSYAGQMLDELPMIWAVSVFLYAMPTDAFREKYGTTVIVVCVLYSAIVTVMYVQNKDANFHEVCYGIGATTIILRCIYMYRENSGMPQLAQVLKFALACYLGAFVLWCFENTFCTLIRQFRDTVGWPVDHLTELHAWWHVGVGLGSYSFIVFMSMCRQIELRESQARIRWKTLAPGIAIAYVYKSAP